MSGLRKIPSVVQLPGGLRLQGLAFRVVDYDAEGRPLRFELLPPSEQQSVGPGIWILFGDGSAIRSSVPEGRR